VQDALKKLGDAGYKLSGAPVSIVAYRSQQAADFDSSSPLIEYR
jgi:hypothetical protein